MAATSKVNDLIMKAEPMGSLFEPLETIDRLGHPIMKRVVQNAIANTLRLGALEGLSPA